MKAGHLATPERRAAPALERSRGGYALNSLCKKSVYMLISFMLLIAMFAFPVSDQTAHAEDDMSSIQLAYEPFNYAAGTGLEGLDGGYGWDGAWQTRSGMSGDIYVMDTDPPTLDGRLITGGVDTEGNYVANPVSVAQSSMYRKFDLSADGAFKTYADIANNRLYQPGTTLWASAILRADSNTENQFSWSPFSDAEFGKFVAIGYMGKKNAGGIKTWNVYDKANNVDVATSKPIVPGESVFVIVKIEFNSTTKVSYYLNPMSDGERPFTSPSYTMTFSYPSTAGIDRTLIDIVEDAGSIDEIRYGDTFASVTPGMNTVIILQPTVPTFITMPRYQTVSPGSMITMKPVVGSPDASYQWLKDDVELEGETSPSLTIKNFSSRHAGDYKIKVTYPGGVATGPSSMLTLGEFTGFLIAKTQQAPIIGEFDSSVWSQAQSYDLSNHVAIAGGADPVAAADHSGSVKALWDDANLYLLYDIKDDMLIKAGGDASTLDSVELFLDRDNSQDATYGPGDFQFIFAYDSSVGVQETKHNTVTGVTYQSMDQVGGYLIEAQIPWTTIGLVPSEGAYLGWDAASDDTDGSDRKSKIAWHTTDNDIWQYPNLMGVAMLAAGDSTPEPDPDPAPVASLEAYIGEHFDLTLGLSGVTKMFNLLTLNIQYDPAKLEFATKPLDLPDHPEAMALADDAIIVAPDNPDLKIVASEVMPDGIIHVAAMKSGGVIEVADKLFTLHGKVKSGLAEGSTTVSLTDVFLIKSDEGSTMYLTEGNSYVIELKTRDTVNTTALADMIGKAQARYNAMEEGTKITQYASGAKSTLQAAISQAASVLGLAAIQQELDDATAALASALQASASQIITLTPGESRITVRDLALLAIYFEKSREEAGWELYDTADIYGEGITTQVIAKVARLLLEDWLSQQ